MRQHSEKNPHKQRGLQKSHQKSKQLVDPVDHGHMDDTGGEKSAMEAQKPQKYKKQDDDDQQADPEGG